MESGKGGLGERESGFMNYYVFIVLYIFSF